MQTSNVVLLLVSFSAVAAVLFNGLASRLAHVIAALFARLEASYERRVLHAEAPAKRPAPHDRSQPQGCG